jgi:hypothetical protein
MRGRPSLLSPTLGTLVVGFVLWMNGRAEKVLLRTVHDFIRQNFKIDMSKEPIRRFLKHSGFTIQKMKKRKGEIFLQPTALANTYRHFILDDLRPRLKGLSLTQVASIDFTYSSHRLGADYSWAPAGTTPTKIDEKVKFTNCVVTCLWADGMPRTPPILFTYCTLLKDIVEPTRGRTSAAERRRVNDYFRALKGEFGLSDSQVVVLPDPKGGKAYCAESPAVVRAFMQSYAWPPGCLLLHDAGNAYMENKKNILADYVAATLEYPPAVHHWLSANDNNHHTRAKAKWRNRFPSELPVENEEVLDALSLLYHLNQDPPPHIKADFEQNLFLGETRQRAVEIKDILRLMGKGAASSLLEEPYYAYARNLYERYREIEATLDDDPTHWGLDGAYWNQDDELRGIARKKRGEGL